MALTSFKTSYRQEIETLFLREMLFDDPKSFSEAIQDGILNMLDSLSDYKEEGHPLFPEIAIISSVYYLERGFPHFKKIKMGTFTLPVNSHAEFEKILKTCAPLAVGGWIIYIEINQFSSPFYIEFGLLNGEENELSAAIKQQIFLIGEKKKRELKCIYIQNMGQKTVCLEGVKNNQLNLAFSTIASVNSPYEYIQTLARHITKGLRGKLQKQAFNYLVKGIYAAINQGHGTLIAVAKGPICIEENFIGHQFEIPIDFSKTIGDILATNQVEKFHELKQMNEIVKAAISNDGITIFSQDAKLIGQHFIIHKKAYLQTSGGARSQAFEAMIESKKFSCCFYKSQDGRTLIWTEK